MCYVIGSEDEFEAAAQRCLAEGLAAGQKLFRFLPAAATDRHAAGNGLPITFADPARDFLNDGPLVPEVMLSMFAEQTSIARREGYTGIRLVADMDWMLAHPPTPEQVAAFELVLDKAVAELGVTVVCAYRPGSFGLGVTEAAAVHPQHAGSGHPPPLFRMWYVDDDAWQISGQVDLAAIVAFERALQTAAAAGPVRTVGCAGLAFISAAGIAALSRLADTPAPHPMLIQDASGIVRRCWQVLGLHELQPYVKFGDSTSRHAAGDARPAGHGDAA